MPEIRDRHKQGCIYLQGRNNHTPTKKIINGFWRIAMKIIGRRKDGKTTMYFVEERRNKKIFHKIIKIINKNS